MWPLESVPVINWPFNYMTCVFNTRKQRFSVFDFISDQPPFNGKERNNNNNNNESIFNCNTCVRDGSHFSTWSPRRFISAMKIETAVSNVNKREINISSLLEPDEAASVCKYVGNNAALLASGMCQVLTAEDGQWTNPITGVLCYIKDYDNKVITLSLLEPGIHSSTAQVNWLTTVSRQFETSKNHSHLLTFEMEAPGFNVIGLNFFSEAEAANFHETVKRERESYLNRRVGTKRQAPPPPTAATAGEAHHHQSESSLMVLPAAMSTTSAVGIHTEIPSNTKTKKKDKKKKGFFGTIFGKSSKKKKIQLADISAPSNFQKISHLEESQQMLLHQIMDTMKLTIDHVNEDQLKYLVNVVKEKEHELKTTIESTTTEPSDEEQLREPSNLSGTRSSMRIKRGSREAGRTPRDVKKADAHRKSDNISTSSSDRPVTPAPADFGQPKDPLKPDWEDENQNYASVAPSHTPYSQTKSSPPIPSSNPIRSDSVEAAPPLPARTVSRRAGFKRQDTPPNPEGSSNVPHMPRLPPRVDSIRGARDVSSRPSLSSSTFVKPLPSEPYDSSRHRPPSPPTSPPPPLPSTTVPLRVDTPRVTASLPPVTPPTLAPPPPPPVISVGGPPPPAPPPPPSDLMSVTIKTPPTMTPPMSPPGSLLSPTSNAATVSPDRRSFLDEIQSVDKNKLLRTVTSAEKSPKGDRESGIHGGLLDSIQRELEARRTQIGSSSDEDSTDSDSGDEWSDD